MGKSKDVAVFTHGASSLPFPGIIVQEFGILPLPLTEDTAKNLLQFAKPCLHGKGTATLFDETIRRCHAIEPTAIRIQNPQWRESLGGLVDSIMSRFGHGQAKVTAHLYNMLIYGPGDHFNVFHRDTEKESGMFATLILQLPSVHKGGELIMRFRDKEHSYDFGVAEGSSIYSVHYAAHFADVEHKVAPVTEGYRVVLVYNLAWESGDELPSAAANASRLASALQSMKTWRESDSDKHFAFELSHKYTIEALQRNGLGALKGKDSATCAALQALNRVLPEENKLRFGAVFYERSITYELDDEESDIDEKWICLDAFPSEQRTLDLKADLLFGSYGSDDEDAWGEPDKIKEDEGYYGNEGGSTTKIYRKFFLAFWPFDARLESLAKTFSANDMTKYLVEARSHHNLSDESVQQALNHTVSELKRPLNDETFVNLVTLALDCKNEAAISAILSFYHNLPQRRSTVSSSFNYYSRPESRSVPGVSAKVFENLAKLIELYPAFEESVGSIVLATDSPTDSKLSCASVFLAKNVGGSVIDAVCLQFADRVSEISDYTTLIAGFTLLFMVKHDVALSTAIKAPSKHYSIVLTSLHEKFSGSVITNPYFQELCCRFAESVAQSDDKYSIVNGFTLLININQTEALSMAAERLPSRFLSSVLSTLDERFSASIANAPFFRELSLRFAQNISQERYDSDLLTGFLVLLNINHAEAHAIAAKSVRANQLSNLIHSLLRKFSDSIADNPAFQELLRVRIDALRRVAARGEPLLTWAWPGASIRNHPEVSAFLQSPAKSMVYTGAFTGLPQARKFAREHTNTQESLICEEGGRARDTFVTIHKTTDRHKVAVANYRAEMEELRELELLLRAPEEPPKPDPVPVQHVIEVDDSDSGEPPLKKQRQH